MFRSTECQDAQIARPDIGAMFARYHHSLRGRVAAVVHTSQANVEDACMHAWVQLFNCELHGRPEHTNWLTTVAIREAVKLDRGDRRTVTLSVEAAGERLDPHDAFAVSDQLAYAAAVIQEAGLTERQLHMLSLQLSGMTYAQIAQSTTCSLRVVERQILRAHEKIAEILALHRGEKHSAKRS
jgi:DNA-directed RNA polymerase specialized sigma24 family protein